jgi:quinol monooxygenase YgiN
MGNDSRRTTLERAMVHVLIHHKVASFEAWKAVFDSAFMMRKAAGERSFHLYHDVADPLDLTLFFEWESANMAERFLKSDQLKNEMQKAGVQGELECHILQELVTMRRTAAD